MQKYLHLHIKLLQSILSDFTKKFAKFSTTIFIKKIVTLKLSEKILKFTLVFFLLLLKILKYCAKSNNKKNTRENFRIFSLSFKVTIFLIKIVVLNFANFLVKSDNIDYNNLMCKCKYFCIFVVIVKE